MGMNVVNINYYHAKFGPIALISISDEKYNVLDQNLIQKLWEALLEIEAKPEIKLVILHSNNPVSFCAGGDLKAIYNYKNKVAEVIREFKKSYLLIDKIKNFKVPFISFVDGFAIGAGAGIALNVTYPVISKKAVFSTPEVKHGFFPDSGMRHILSKLPNKHGLFLSLTGAKINANTALSMKLANYYYDLPFENFLLKIKQVSCIHNFMTSIKSNIAIASVKSPLLNSNLEEIFLKSKTCKFLNVINTFSPLAVGITYYSLLLGLKQDIKSCLVTDFRIINNMLKNSDMIKGIENFILKHNSTNWNYDNYSKEVCLKYFKPIKKELMHLSNNIFLG